MRKKGKAVFKRYVQNQTMLIPPSYEDLVPLNLVRYKQQIRERLTSEEGIQKRKQRWQVEAAFGNIKQNKGFRRFNLRGIDKVNIEISLLAIAHNLQRFSTKAGH